MASLAAAGIGLVGSLLGSIFGGNAASHAATQASQLQYQAAQQAIAEQRRQFDVTQGNEQPWLTAGTLALGQQGDLTGLNGPGIQQSAITSLQNSPFYQSLYNNGLQANLQNASATGGLRGGNEVNSLAHFGADTLAQTIQQQLANLGSISGTGQQTATQLGQFGANEAGNVGNLINQGAAAQAGGVLARGGIQAQQWANLGSALGGGTGSNSLSAILPSLLKMFG